VRRIDYDEISSRYDRHRRVDESVARMVLSSARPPELSAVLELGCGTGSLTRHIEHLHRGPVIGLDLSEGMLDRARAKLSRACLVRADALRAPFREGAFALVAGMFFIHHVPAARLGELACEVRRVLATGGAVVLVTSSHEQIRAHHLNRFFPSFAEVDCARFPAVEKLCAELEFAGLSVEGAPPVALGRYRLDDGYLEKLLARHISTLELIGEDEYERGLVLFKRMLEEGGLPAEYAHHATVVVARKGG
jgi:ubiquinone/menaquinone biosynthesis C-methylase UbiE